MGSKPQTIDAFLKMIGCIAEDEIWGTVRKLSEKEISLLHTAVAKGINAAYDRGYFSATQRPLPQGEQERRVPTVTTCPRCGDTSGPDE